MKKEKIIIVSIFIFLLVSSFYLMETVLENKSIHGTVQAQSMYYQPKDTIDVVFMGSSHIHCDINTAYLWEHYGIAGYDYSSAEQPLWITYYYLKEICKYQSPKLVVLDLYSPARFKDDYQYDWLSESLQGVRLSGNKIGMLMVSCEINRIPDFFPDIVTYHSRYNQLTKEDWDAVFSSRREKGAFKGYIPFWGQNPQIQPELDQVDSGDITVKSEMYLQKIIDYTKENDIKLFLIVSPYVTNSNDELVYNRVHEIADRNGLKFNSTNYAYDYMELDFKTDFSDDSHLNYWGSCKFSEYLGQEIKKNYLIPDRRGKAEWESWDRHVTEIEKAVLNAEGENQ